MADSIRSYFDDAQLSLAAYATLDAHTTVRLNREQIQLIARVALVGVVTVV